jgi:ABC-2 type transport system permease protein
MLFVILKKEIRETFRDGRFRVLAAIITILLAVSSWVSYNHQQQLRQLHEQAQIIERKVWETQKSKNPHGAAHFGQYVFKPVYPLSVIDPGIDRYTGVMQYLEAHKRNHEQFSALQDQTELARFADLTPAFVLLFLMPLLLIVLGYNAVTREKENGSFRLLLAQGAPVFTILTGKWLAIIASVGVFLLPVLLITGVLLSQLNHFYWSVFLCFIGIYLIYYAIIAGTTVVISSLAKKSGLSFLGALLFWIITSILLPRFASNLANIRAPLLTNEEITQWVNSMNKSRGGNIHDLSGDMYKHLVDSLLKKYHVDSVSKLPVNMAGIRLDMGEQMDTRNFEIVYDSMFHQLDRQQQWLNYGATFSPFLLTQDISMHLAQTDNENHRHFSDAGESYRRDLVNRMNRHIAYESKRQEAFTQFEAPDSLWKSVPKFQYTGLAGQHALKMSRRSITILFAWLLTILLALFITSKRLKP